MLVLLPLILIVLAILAACIVAYGTEPFWASFGAHGLDIILWSRRLEWPAMVTALLLCAGLLFVVISAKRRIWWLIGLLPVLVLIYHRFTAGPTVGYSSASDPVFVTADKIPSLPPNDLVVGLIWNNQPCAFPCSELFLTPVVVRTGREKPLLLLWSADANRALAFVTDRDVRAADLEIVSSPDDALVIYNARLGQFINSVTGRTFKGEVPTGFHEQLNVVKTTWLAWRSAHPDTQVMNLPPATGSFLHPQPPQYIPHSDPRTDQSISLIATTQPIALASDAVTDKPLNLSIGKSSLLVVRVNGVVRVFNRELPGDLVPRFTPTTDPKHPAVAWIDSDTNSEWNTKGEWVAGPAGSSTDMHGNALVPVVVEDNLDLNVMKFWYPDLHLATFDEIAAAKALPPVRKPDKSPTTRRRPRAKG